MRAMSAPDIPGYRILRPLNSGGMATVYLAEQLSLGREVAIKLIADHLRTDAGFAERFAQEARIASRLDHPHIVTVFDYGTVPDGEGGAHHYLVMARIEGADYHRALPGMPLPQRVRVVGETAAALAHAHAQGVVHRDIKPQNILVQAHTGRALLTDFGVARLNQRPSGLTGVGMALGTPHYTAPEQAMGEAVDHRADLYSLGVLLFVSLTGEVPFDADSEVAIAMRHINDPVPRLPEALARFQPVVDRAMAKAPQDRYGDAEAFAAALAEVPLDDLTHAAPSAPSGGTTPSPSAAQGATPVPAAMGAAGQATRAGPAPRSPAPVWRRHWHLLALAVLALVLASSLFAIWRDARESTQWVPAQAAPEPAPIEAPPAAAPPARPAARPTAPAAGAPTPSNPPARAVPTTVRIDCRLRLLDDARLGWRAELSLHNASPTDLREWRAELRLPNGSLLLAAPAARLSSDGDRHVLTPRRGNAGLRAGERLQIDLAGTGTAPRSARSLACTGEPVGGRQRTR